MNVLKLITHFVPWILGKYKPSGLLPTPPDERDYMTHMLGWGAYEPKNVRKINKTYGVKNQESLNTCQWNATTTCKEPDEAMELSVRYLVSVGKRMGLVSGNGFSDMRSGQKVLQKYGICAEVDCPDVGKNNWDLYSSIWQTALNDKAEAHKIKQYWSVSNRNDIIKLLDDGKCMSTGIEWYSGYNQSGGFRAPWIISSKVGYFVGGHAISLIGYDLNYQGKKVYIFQNSYGADWGDNGKFYITMDFFDKNNYGVFANLDDGMDANLFLSTYNGVNVKGDKMPGIYFIINGEKHVYNNMECFMAFNAEYGKGNYVKVRQQDLDKIPEGASMNIEQSNYWPFIKNVKDRPIKFK